MKKSLLLATLLSLFLVGCSSTPINDASKPTGPSVSDDEKDLDLASLRDPNNILSANIRTSSLSPSGATKRCENSIRLSNAFGPAQVAAMSSNPAGDPGFQVCWPN